MEEKEGGLEGEERFNKPFVSFFKWESEGFKGIRRSKIPFQTLHF